MSEEKVREPDGFIKNLHEKRIGQGMTFTIHRCMPLGDKTYQAVHIFTSSELALHDEKIAREAWDAAIESCENIGEWPEFEDWWKKRGSR